MDNDENHIKIYFLLGGSEEAPNKIIQEVKTDLFLKSIKVMRRGDEYNLICGPIEVQLPRPVGKEMIEDMLMMLDHEDRLEILKEVESNL